MQHFQPRWVKSWRDSLVLTNLFFGGMHTLTWVNYKDLADFPSLESWLGFGESSQYGLNLDE